MNEPQMTIADMIGRTPSDIYQSDDRIVFEFTDGSAAHFYHNQDCCETVKVDDVNGNWLDLIGHPMLVADERVGEYPEGGNFESVTWTFYTFRNIGGSVDVRWCGESNGYYSESVDFRMTAPK